MAMVPSRAPRGPPLTGASTNVTPALARRAAWSRLIAGSPDVISTKICPGFKSREMPASPKSTVSVTADVGRQAKIMSQDLQSSNALFAAIAPLSINGANLILSGS